MTYLYFGGSLADFENERVKIGVTDDLLKRSNGYKTGSAPSNGFSFRLIVHIESFTDRNAYFWEEYFLIFFPEDESTSDNKNYFYGTEFRRNIDYEKVKNIMLDNQSEDKYIFYEGENIEFLFQNVKEEKKIISREWNLKNLLLCFNLPGFNKFQIEALKIDKTEGIFHLPTGTGKFLIGLGLIIQRNPIKTLWIAPRNDILDEQYEQMKVFSKYFNIRLIKCYGGNIRMKDFNIKNKFPIIILSNPDTLRERIEKIEDLKMIIYDEVQYLPSEKFGDKIMKIRNKIEYFYGFSATPYTEDDKKEKLNNLNLPIIYDRNFMEAMHFNLVPKPQTRLIHSNDIWNSLLERIGEWNISGFWRWAIYFSTIEKVDDFYQLYKDNSHLKLYYSHSKEVENTFPNLTIEPIENELLIFCERGRVGVNINSLAGVFIARDNIGLPHITVQILGRPRREIGKNISFFTVFLPPGETENTFGEHLARGLFEDFEGNELFTTMENKYGLGCLRVAIKHFKELIDSENNYNEDELFKLIIRNTSKKDWERTLRIVRSLKFKTPEEYEEKAKDYGLENKESLYSNEKFKKLGWWHYLNYPSKTPTLEEFKNFIQNKNIKYKEDYLIKKPSDYPDINELDYGFFGYDITSNSFFKTKNIRRNR